MMIHSINTELRCKFDTERLLVISNKRSKVLCVYCCGVTGCYIDCLLWVVMN